MNTDILTNPHPSDRLHKAILAALETETKQIVEEEAKKAAERAEQRVRGMLGQIATSIATHVSFEGFGRELRITVHLPECDKGDDRAARS
jgi:hypothetical protein